MWLTDAEDVLSCSTVGNVEREESHEPGTRKDQTVSCPTAYLITYLGGRPGNKTSGLHTQYDVLVLPWKPAVS